MYLGIESGIFVRVRPYFLWNTHTIDLPCFLTQERNSSKTKIIEENIFILLVIEVSMLNFELKEELLWMVMRAEHCTKQTALFA